MFIENKKIVYIEKVVYVEIKFIAALRIIIDSSSYETRTHIVAKMLYLIHRISINGNSDFTIDIINKVMCTSHYV